MALQLKDRVRTACTTIGKAEIEIGSNRAGFQNWDGITDGNTVYYCVVEGNRWEVGYGVKTGTEITRNLLSSSTGSLISLDGTADVFETYPAEKSVILNTDGNIELPSSNIKANKFIGDGSSLTNIPTIDDTYTKTQTDTLLDSKANVGDSYTKAETYNNTEIDSKLFEKANKSDVDASQDAQDVNIASNTTAIGTLSGQVSQNSEDIAELQDSIFFTSAYSADYPSSPNRDPEDGNMYLQNFAMFTYSYAEATQIFCSKTDESGNVRQFTAVKAGDSIVLNEVDSPNYGRYELVSIEDVSDSYVVMNVIPKLGQGTVITGVKVAFQAFPKPGTDGVPEAPIDGKQYGRQDAEWTEVEATGGGTVADGCIYLNNQTITSDYTIPTGKNGMSAGAIKFDGTVTVPEGSAYHVVDNTPKVLSENRNIIINGDMRIDQRNAGASVTPFNNDYCLDRYGTGLSKEGKYSVQQVTDSPANFTNSLKVTSLSAYTLLADDYFMIKHKIEGNNVGYLNLGSSDAQEITLSFYVKSSLTGTFSGSFENDNESRAYPFTYTISSANTWEKVSVTLTGDTTGTWLTDNSTGLWINFGLGVGTTYSGTASSWSAGPLLSATGATSVVSTNSATWQITGVQLEAGEEATPFEHVPYDVQLQRCFRYFEIFGGGNLHGGSYNGEVTIGHVQYKARKRAIPTVSGTAGSNIATVVAGIDNFHFTGTQPSYVTTAVISAEL